MNTLSEIQFALDIANQVKQQWRESIDNLTPELFESVLNGKPSDYLKFKGNFYVVYGPEEGSMYGAKYLKEKGFTVCGKEFLDTPKDKSGISFNVPNTNKCIHEVIMMFEMEKITKSLDMIMDTLTSTNFKKLEYGESVVHNLCYRGNKSYTLTFDNIHSDGDFDGYVYCAKKLKQFGYKNLSYGGNNKIYFTV